MTRSWIDKETTDRIYLVNSPQYPLWRIRNEYQRVKCPDCEKIHFCRLTRIWYFDQNKKQRENDPEIHTNYKKELSELKELVVTYSSRDDQNVGICEVKTDGNWKLKRGEIIIGEEIKKNKSKI